VKYDCVVFKLWGNVWQIELELRGLRNKSGRPDFALKFED
jgi:hypothetical protein